MQDPLYQQQLAERRQCTRVCRPLIKEDRRQFSYAIADMRTENPVHNRVLDKVIALLESVLKEEDYSGIDSGEYEG